LRTMSAGCSVISSISITIKLDGSGSRSHLVV
jgi:hypothetical protein